MRTSYSPLSPRFKGSAFRVIAALLILPLGMKAVAQNDRRIPVKGYITAVASRDRFDVNNLHVLIQPDTGFGLIGNNARATHSPLQDALKVGVYVEVVGSFEKKNKTASATGIYLRDDWDAKLSGLAVIDRVISRGPEPVYRADGYLIRVTQATDTNFSDELNSFADIGPNSWIRYEGRRDSTGMLVASKATFLPGKSAKYKKTLGGSEEPGQNLMPLTARHAKAPTPATDPNAESPKIAINPNTGNRADFEQILDKDGNLTSDATIHLGAFGEWHTIPADRDLQARVRRIGNSVVPAYQKDLAADHPSKIHFRFYAVDDEKVRSEICPISGLVLVPKQVVARLKNDDQLAAVLADGVAYNLQRQDARIAADNRVFLGASLAISFTPVIVFLPALNAEIHYANKINTALYQERARLALELLADAQYDPRQAPEAWRLLAPKHLPSDPASLPYGEFSGYQLSILNLQYPTDPTNQHPSGSVAMR